MVAEDPLGLAQFEDKYRLAMELFEVRILLEPEVAAVASRNATEEEKQHIKELCDETERIYLEGKNNIAILRGDSMGAKCAMIMHLTYNRQKLLELIEQREKSSDKLTP